MKSKWLIWLICLGVFGLSVQAITAQDEASDLLGRINGLRASQGLPGYTISGALSSAAYSQAQWMIDNGCAIAHVHPDGSSPRTRSTNAGYPSTDVSENIYCGTTAGTNDAWIFWINSAIHYRGLVNARYQEIGIASAHGAVGASYVLVFGNPSGQIYIPPAPSGSNSGEPQGQPSYVLGLDEHGNIMHEIQPGETLGDIALIYGYTWGDIPGMLTMNGLTQDDIRLLEPGAVFLVPSHAGTYTPTPGGDAPTSTATAFVEPTKAFIPTDTPTQDFSVQPTPIPTHILAATSNSLPQSVAMLLATATPQASVTAQETADATQATGRPQTLQSGVVITRPGTSPWLIIALVVQVGVIALAGVQFARRKRKR
jgi:hypothetical protein